MKIPKSAIFTAVLVTATLIVSCYAPLTDKLIAAIEDDYAPVIIVETPLSGDTYYSTILVSGYINDDSLGSGDNKGLLRSLSFTAGSDLDHKGKIIIDSEGDYESDPAFGNKGDDINYYTDRSFDFEITTSDLGFPPQTLYILITAVDFNGNETIELIQLIRSIGPFIELTSPAAPTYGIGSTITIQGNIANSQQHVVEATADGLPIEAGEVDTLKLEVFALGINVELDVNREDEDPPQPPEVSVPLITRSGDFQYDPAQRTFYTEISLNLPSDEDITSMIINLIATDLNGNVTTLPHTMTQVEDTGPKIDIYQSELDENGLLYYSRTVAGPPLLFVLGGTRTHLSSLVVYGSTYTPLTSLRVNLAELKLVNTPYNNTIDLRTHANTLHWGPDIDPMTGYWYYYDYYRFNVSLNGSIFQGFTAGDTANLTLTVEDNEGKDTLISWLIKEDSNGPIFSLMTATTDSATSPYVGSSDTVTLNFTLTDEAFKTGLNPDTIRGSIGGKSFTDPAYPGTFSKVDNGDGSWSCTLALAASDIDPGTGLLGDGTLIVSVLADDYIGNTSSKDQSDFDQTITYLINGPTLSIVTFTTAIGNDEYAQKNEIITVSFTTDQDLNETSLTVFIGAVEVTPNKSGMTYTATRSKSSSTDTVLPFEISGIQNLAGITTGDITEVSGAGDSDVVHYYPDAPVLENVSITLVKGGVNSESYPEDGDTIHLEFNVVGDRDLTTDPTVSLTAVTDSGPPEITTTVYLSSTADSGPAPYVYDHVLDAADVALVDALDLIVDFIDMADNAGQHTDVDIYDLTP